MDLGFVSVSYNTCNHVSAFESNYSFNIYLCQKIGFKLEKTVKYWLELSDYDMETAVAMLHSKRYLYVGFMCHQSIEKIFKGYYAKFKAESAPYSHGLSYLAEKGGFYQMLTAEQKAFIDELEPLNIEAWYPSHKERLIKSLNEKKCFEIIDKTKELQQWIKRKL